MIEFHQVEIRCVNAGDQKFKNGIKKSGYGV